MVVLFVAIAIYEVKFKQSTVSFETFLNNFNSAQRIAIYATAYNGTILSSTVGCATAIIQKIVGSQQMHRDSSTIDFYVINETTCTYAENGLGHQTNGYITTPVSNCLNVSRSETTIYINYSSTNITIIKPNYLYFSGDQLFLSQCGIAEQLS